MSGEVCIHRLYNGGQVTKVMLNKIYLCCAEHLTEECYMVHTAFNCNAVIL